MFSEEHMDKLFDYLSGMKDVQNPMSYPIGVILVSDDDRAELIETLGMQEVSVLTLAAHPDGVLRALVDSVQHEEPVASEVIGTVPGPVMSALFDLSEGALDVVLAGDVESTVINPVPKKGGVVLIMNEEVYSEFSKPELINSACRLI